MQPSLEPSARRIECAVDDAGRGQPLSRKPGFGSPGDKGERFAELGADPAARACANRSADASGRTVVVARDMARPFTPTPTVRTSKVIRAAAAMGTLISRRHRAANHSDPTVRTSTTTSVVANSNQPA